MPQSYPSPSGRQINCPEGYQTFLPNPLLPELQWGKDLVALLSEADRAIGRLAGEGGSLPHPHLLIRPFLRREAVLSSRIEGTQATLGEILAAEAGAVVERSPSDLKEVANYVAALEYGIKRLDRLPLSLRLIKELHAKLMTGVRGGHATPGEFRRSQNWIGPAGCTLSNATFIPPPPSELMKCLGDWEHFLQDRSLPPLVQAALGHYQLEAIHPFIDGNGRVGRLFITLFLIERQVLPTPLLYLSAFFEATCQEYYDRLLGISRRNEWDKWLVYFLTGVARQAEDALSRAERINGLLVLWRKKVAGETSKILIHLIDLLTANPYLTINKAADQLHVAFTTAQRGIERLAKLGIVKQTSPAKRDRVYCAQSILKILEEPPQLTQKKSQQR